VQHYTSPFRGFTHWASLSGRPPHWHAKKACACATPNHKHKDRTYSILMSIYHTRFLVQVFGADFWYLCDDHKLPTRQLLTALYLYNIASYHISQLFKMHRFWTFLLQECASFTRTTMYRHAINSSSTFKCRRPVVCTDLLTY